MGVLWSNQTRFFALDIIGAAPPSSRRRCETAPARPPRSRMERQQDPRHVCVCSAPANSVILVLVVSGHSGSGSSSIADSLGAELTYTLTGQAGDADAESAVPTAAGSRHALRQ